MLNTVILIHKQTILWILKDYARGEEAEEREAAKKKKEKMEAALKEKVAAIKKKAEEIQKRNEREVLKQKQNWQDEGKNDDSSCTVRKTVFSTACNSNHK